MTLPEITWTGSNDDFTAICGDYILRVEQIGNRKWWYQAYLKERVLIADTKFKRTETEAKQAAEIEFYKHYISQI